MKRFWEIDYARGLAVALMVLFNYSFALDYFRIYSIADGWIYWWLFPRIIAGIFIFLVGMSLTISYSRNKSKSRLAIRGAKIFALGMLATAATWLLFPQETIWFGILHLIGISIILSVIFLKFERLNLFLGILLAAIGVYLSNFTFDFPWLLWLGFAPSFSTFDYFPLLPWLGLVLVGMFFGRRLYKNGRTRVKRKPLTGSGVVCFLGRHSLIIYVLHQPVLLLILHALALF